MDKKKIKVTHVTRFAYPHIGGIESVINQINDSLPNEEFEKEVLCCSNTEKTSIENGVKYNRARYLFEIFNNTISLSFLWKLSRVKTDVLHYHMPFIFAVVAHFIARPKYKKMYITYHSDLIAYEKIMKYFWWIYKKLYAIADKIFVLSPNAIDRDPILRENKEKIVVIPYGINTEISNAIAEKRHINGIDIKEFAKNRKILLCMGRFVNLKGFIYAIKTMETIENAVLLVAGNGELKTYFEQYIKEHHLEDKVKLIGFVSKEKDKEFLFSNIDIFLMTSIKTESFSIVQLEAMKYGKPIINTNLGTGVNYVSVDKETGLTVEPENIEQLANAINELLNNDELRLQYGRNAMERVEKKFNLKKIRLKYSKIYEGIN